MVSVAILGVALSLGQPLPEPLADVELPLAEKPCRNTPAEAVRGEHNAPQAGAQPEQEADASSKRWLLMNLLQDSPVGKTLESHRLEITGWTALGFLTSTSPAEPGGNWAPRLNQVLLRQEWIRIDRPIDAGN